MLMQFHSVWYGGSSSQDGFEYNDEFHSKPLHPDAKQLTITLHEIIIQECFPREDSNFTVSRRPMRVTKDEYANIDKSPFETFTDTNCTKIGHYLKKKII